MGCENCGPGKVPNSDKTACQCDTGKVPNSDKTACQCDTGKVPNPDGSDACVPGPAQGLVQGTITIGGTGTFRRRKNWAIFGKDDVKDILKEAFCDNIISGSIVTGSCDLQVLDY